MVAAGVFGHIFQVLGPRQLFEHLDRCTDVVVDGLAFGLGQRAGADGKEVDFLSPDELENLTIRAGTLTQAERQTINHHVSATIKMLEQLPWPKHLTNVPEYAGGHHERMDGKGYPRGLKREEMSWQARMMGIADIFEALTAGDRPYKDAMTLTQALGILDKFRHNGHIDPDLHDVFVNCEIYRKYADEFLDAKQVDC